jgi:IMP dehydrogenase
MAVELARLGGCAFIYCSQPAEEQANMVKQAKNLFNKIPNTTGTAGAIGAAVNTHDYQERVPALVEAGVDVISLDSSDGFSIFQATAIKWIRTRYPKLPLIGGNIVTADGFRFLAESGVDAVKVGMGGGSICITQEQKGTGRGLATAIIDVVEARDQWKKHNGIHIPVIADGGITTAKDITMALAMGCEAVMMGRYFARMEESPTEKITLNNKVMKPYWGEGSPRASAWKSNRYHQSKFSEGVEGFVEYKGTLEENLSQTTAKIRASMSSCGCPDIPSFHKNAVLEIVSQLSIREGQVHDIFMPDIDNASYARTAWGEE